MKKEEREAARQYLREVEIDRYWSFQMTKPEAWLEAALDEIDRLRGVLEAIHETDDDFAGTLARRGLEE